jgi:hypothetical protein
MSVIAYPPYTRSDRMPSGHQPSLMPLNCSYPVLTSWNHLPPTPTPAYTPVAAAAVHLDPAMSMPTEIIPRLFISDLASAEDPRMLRRYRITHVVTAMRGFAAVPDYIVQHHVPLDDHPFAEIASYLPHTSDWIHRALSSSPNACVLVHCAEGISRSVSVVCAYLMYLKGWNPTRAIQEVQSRRVIAQPNFGFVKQLHEYHDTLHGLRRHPAR